MRVRILTGQGAGAVVDLPAARAEDLIERRLAQRLSEAPAAAVEVATRPEASERAARPERARRTRR